MKKLIFLELILLFLATTFQSDNPPGWYQQTLPVSDQINDIFFLDSLSGWLVTDSQNGTTDSSYIMRTTNGGNNWEINYQTFVQFKAIQFANSEIGYACGISSGPEFFKTTNGGVNWNILNVLTSTWKSDLCFINKDTGWVCSSDPFDGGVFKTTNGGISWVQEINLGIGNPLKIFFVNSDTGWFGNDFEQLYKTTNGGLNWNIQYAFKDNSIFKDLFFMNGDTGWVCESNQNRVQFTSNGGNNWFQQTLPPEGGIILTSRPNSISSTDGKVVSGVGGNVFFGMGRVRGIIYKTTNSGTNWFYQLPDTSINIATYTNIQFISDSAGWASNTGIIHTTDGGGPLVNISKINSVLPKSFLLFQNYPNPFNPNTVIMYQLTANSFIRLKLFDITGKEIKTLVNQRQNSGEYKIDFNGSDLISGVYFYQLEATGNKTNETFSETKKMLLVK